MSTVTLSKPHCAITSAVKPEGIASQAFTTALPDAQICLTLLFAIVRVSSSCLDDGPARCDFNVSFRHSRAPGQRRTRNLEIAARDSGFALRAPRNDTE